MKLYATVWIVGEPVPLLVEYDGPSWAEADDTTHDDLVSDFAMRCRKNDVVRARDFSWNVFLGRVTKFVVRGPSEGENNSGQAEEAAEG